MKLIHSKIGRKYSAGKKIKVFDIVDGVRVNEIDAWLYVTDSGKEYIKYTTGVISNMVPQRNINYQLI